MRKRVSANIRIFRFSAWVIVGIAVMIILENFSRNAATMSIPVGCGALVLSSVLGYCVYRFFDAAKTIEFDQSHVYISGRAAVKAIPHTRIISIKRTSMYMNNRYTWRITYLQDEDTKASVIFLPRLFSMYMPEFKNLAAGYGVDIHPF